jgi:hypothetical protein
MDQPNRRIDFDYSRPDLKATLPSSFEQQLGDKNAQFLN